MLYLGQVIKLKLAENHLVPAIFLGFKLDGIKKKAHVIWSPDKGTICGLEIETSSLGFIKAPSKESPTGFKIFKGATCTNVINEHVKLKDPKEEVVYAALKEVLDLKLM